MTTKEGREHCPRYTSTVTVNGAPFQTPSPTRTIKRAQNNAVKVAFFHFYSPRPSPKSPPLPQPSPPLPPLQPFLSQPPSPTWSSSSTPASSSSSNPPAPSSLIPPSSSSSSTPKSPPSPQPSPPLQPSLPQPPSSPAGSSSPQPLPATPSSDMERLYKNQLQNYAQKRNLKLPMYSSEWVDPFHDPCFKGKVTIDGYTYESTEFFLKLKDVENATANVALMLLVPGRAQEIDNGLPVYSIKKFGLAHMPTFVSNVELGGETFFGKEATTKKQAKTSQAKVAHTILKERKGKSEQSPNLATGLQHHENPKSPVRSSLGSVSKNQSEKGKGKIGCAPPLFSCTNMVTGSGSGSSDMPSTAESAPPRRKQKINIYPCKTNMSIEAGGTLLPFSNENWVAYEYKYE